MRPKAARGRAQRAPTNLPECSRLFAGAALCSRPQAFPPEGGRWHGEAVTDEGAYLNRNLYPGGSPKGLPYPGPQSPPCQRGARSGRGIPFPQPSPRGSSLCGCVPALQSGERQKNPLRGGAISAAEGVSAYQENQPAVKSQTRRSCCSSRGEFFYLIIEPKEMLPAFSTKSGGNSRGSLCP